MDSISTIKSKLLFLPLERSLKSHGFLSSEDKKVMKKSCHPSPSSQYWKQNETDHQKRMKRRTERNKRILRELGLLEYDYSQQWLWSSKPSGEF